VHLSLSCRPSVQRERGLEEWGVSTAKCDLAMGVRSCSRDSFCRFSLARCFDLLAAARAVVTTHGPWLVCPWIAGVVPKVAMVGRVGIQ